MVNKKPQKMVCCKRQQHLRDLTENKLNAMFKWPKILYDLEIWREKVKVTLYFAKTATKFEKIRLEQT